MPRAAPAVPYPTFLGDEPIGNDTRDEGDLGVGLVARRGPQPIEGHPRIVVIAQQILKLGQPCGRPTGVVPTTNAIAS